VTHGEQGIDSQVMLIRITGIESERFERERRERERERRIVGQRRLRALC